MKSLETDPHGPWALRQGGGPAIPLLAALLALILAAMWPTRAQAQATVPFADCTADFFLAQQASGDPTTLYRFDTDNNPFLYEVIDTAPANTRYNATAYNPVDNYIYGVQQDPITNVAACSMSRRRSALASSPPLAASPARFAR